MTPTKDIDVAIDACRGADGTVDARAFAAALATPARATEAPSRSLAEIGRDAARKAQREALLATLEACGWNMAHAAKALRMGGTPVVLRSIRSLGLLDEYLDAKRDRRVVAGRRTNASTVTTLQTLQERGRVGA